MDPSDGYRAGPPPSPPSRQSLVRTQDETLRCFTPSVVCGPGGIAFVCCPYPNEHEHEIFQLFVEAPPGFRPSQWVEMLTPIDDCYGLQSDLVDSRFTPRGQVLTVRADMMDPSHPQAEARLGLLGDILAKAGALGLSVNADPRIQAEPSCRWSELQALCAARKIPLSFRAPDEPPHGTR